MKDKITQRLNYKTKTGFPQRQETLKIKMVLEKSWNVKVLHNVMDFGD